MGIFGTIYDSCATIHSHPSTQSSGQEAHRVSTALGMILGALLVISISVI